ncbi:MAG: DUF5063 domain-containing protein [Clostridium sp.]|nr:DUF5063 domain-containing protein [Clostridium sp.]
MNEQYSTVYAHDVIEFVTVSAEFCAYLEQSEHRRKTDFVETTLKLLPLLYLKASLLPRLDGQEDVWMEEYVTEQDYEWLRGTIAAVMGESDSYLELCGDVASGSEETALKTVSEELADVYQAVRNFVGAYQTGNEDNMNEALAVVAANFELYWGQTLTGVLHALHKIRYAVSVSDDMEDEDECCGEHECHCGHHHSH